MNEKNFGYDATPHIVTTKQEKISRTAIGTGVQLGMDISPVLPFRKLYFFNQFVISNTFSDYFAQAELVFRNKGTEVGRIPVSISSDDSNVLKQSNFNGFANSLSNGLYASADTAILNIADPFPNDTDGAEITRIVLAPQFLQMPADRIEYEIIGYSNNPAGVYVSGFRAFIACISSNIPFR